jgi:predicted nuclease with RNAse H fold
VAGRSVLGVDVSLGRGLDVVLLEDSRVKETWSRIGPGALADLLRELRPAVVAVDAPPSPGLGLLQDEAERAALPAPPAPGTHLHRRVAEYELSRRGIGSHQTHHDETRLFSWMTAGFETFAAAAQAGYPVYLGAGPSTGVALEVFPYASYVVLAGCLSPGRRWRLAWRRSVMAAAGLQGLAEGATIDQVDAACAALTGERFVAGSGCWLGDVREGVIVLPMPAVEERYRRCLPPGGSPRSAEARVCECGCGAPVRRRFLPGHDARLKSRLLKDLRAGESAARELARLGWHPGEGDDRSKE